MADAPSPQELDDDELEAVVGGSGLDNVRIRAQHRIDFMLGAAGAAKAQAMTEDPLNTGSSGIEPEGVRFGGQ